MSPANYFGEWLFWVGLWVASGAEHTDWSVAGPITMTVLFLFVSIDLMETRQAERKGVQWEEYVAAVPSSFLPLPPALAAWIYRTQTPPRRQTPQLKQPASSVNTQPILQLLVMYRYHLTGCFCEYSLPQPDREAADPPRPRRPARTRTRRTRRWRHPWILSEPPSAAPPSRRRSTTRRSARRKPSTEGDCQRNGWYCQPSTVHVVERVDKNKKECVRG